jgi:hypothetical protein
LIRIWNLTCLERCSSHRETSPERWPQWLTLILFGPDLYRPPVACPTASFFAGPLLPGS